jgi:hypothetical protein
MAPPSKMAAGSNSRHLRLDQGLRRKNAEDGESISLLGVTAVPPPIPPPIEFHHPKSYALSAVA